MSTWVHPVGTAAHGPWETWLPAGNSLQYAGIQVRAMVEEEHLELHLQGTEQLLVPLSGAFWVQTGDGEYHLARSGSVMTVAPDVLYVPRDEPVLVVAEQPGRLLIASAPATEAHPVQYRRAAEVEVEVRGEPPAQRRVRDLGGEHVIAAQRLLVCEVLTPAGGWSSYPPHKHDVTRPGVESELEEIYYFEIERDGPPAQADHAVGYHRTFASDDRPIDVMAEVSTGDVALVPYGWHGPCMAPPGYAMYYLNVMAGPGPERTWQVTFHPDLDWTRR